MAGGPKQLISQGAPFAPLRYGLLSAATEIPDPTPHWRNGTIIRHDSCGAATSTSFICPPGTGSPKVAAATGAAGDVSAAEPFTVVAWLPCPPIGQGPNLADLEARTVRLLDRSEARAVEDVFWRGVAGTYTIRPHLASDTEVLVNEGGLVGVELQSAATVVTGATVGLVEGVGLLEGALAECYGGEGIIHVPRRLLPALGAVNVRAEGPQLRTLGGNVIAAYSSNNSEGPDGSAAAAGSAWIYGTSMVWYRRSPQMTSGQRPGDYVGRADNTTVFVAERTYILDWDCCHFAVRISTGSSIIDGGA